MWAWRIRSSSGSARGRTRHIDASVLRGETERLSYSQRRAIWELTGAAATRFGYTAAIATGIWAA
jgi:hypothetical protein